MSDDENPDTPRPLFSPLIYLLANIPSSIFMFFFRFLHLQDTIRLYLAPWLSYFYPEPIVTLSLADIYVAKYVEALDKVKQITHPDNPTITTHCIVMENTPTGYVAMQYDKERAAFTYYANNTIPTKLLDVVARKYAVQFHAPQLLQGSDPIEYKSKSKEEETEKTETKSKSGVGMHSGKKRSCFVKLKSAPLHKPEANTNTSTVATVDGTVATVDGTNQPIRPRFIRIGMMTDLVVLRIPPKTMTADSKKRDVTFAEYKKMHALSLAIPPSDA